MENLWNDLVYGARMLARNPGFTIVAILWNRSPGLNIAQDWFSPGQYLDIKNDNHVFEHVAATIGGSFNLTGLGVPEHVDGARVSSSLFPL